VATIVGTLGDDFQIIDFNNGDDEIFGDSTGTVNVATGDDRIFARGGMDVIYGDALTIGPAGRGGDDLIQGGDGDDFVRGDAGGSLFGTGGNDTIYQNSGSGALTGDALDLVGAGARGGNDRLFGTGTLVGDSVLSMASATGGDDLLDAQRATEGSFLYGDVQEEDLDGTGVGGRDRLFGSAFDDVLVGDAGANVDDGARAGDDLLRATAATTPCSATPCPACWKPPSAATT
jgi:RTX calcium-binding nonapeptide repeat (4 copies)